MEYPLEGGDFIVFGNQLCIYVDTVVIIAAPLPCPFIPAVCPDSTLEYGS